MANNSEGVASGRRKVNREIRKIREQEFGFNFRMVRVVCGSKAVALGWRDLSSAFALRFHARNEAPYQRTAGF